MLDRAMGEYIPYIFNERPDLKDQFAGFTYYPNTISYGGHTNFGSPALFGGYEYTPIEMNRRNTELLVDKHNEALRLMPALFSDAGYQVTVCDPVYPNYNELASEDFYSDYPNVSCYRTKDAFTGTLSKAVTVENNMRNFFCYSLMSCIPPTLRIWFYDQGNYYQAVANAGQTASGPHSAVGIESKFLDCLSVLEHLSTMAELTDSGDTFMMMANDITHAPMLLQLPDYAAAPAVNNRAYDESHADTYTVDGVTLKMENSDQRAHYHVNMAALLQLGQWFDWLRQQGIYDNTRIILVSDHGFCLNQLEDVQLPGPDDIHSDNEMYRPLLMVKDFDTSGFTVSDDFMTNADTPVLAMEGLIADMTNPFTGNAINATEKTAHEQYILASGQYNPDINGTTFPAGRWYSAQSDIRDIKNWALIAENEVLS